MKGGDCASRSAALGAQRGCAQSKQIVCSSDISVEGRRRRRPRASDLCQHMIKHERHSGFQPVVAGDRRGRKPRAEWLVEPLDIDRRGQRRHVDSGLKDQGCWAQISVLSASRLIIGVCPCEHIVGQGTTAEICIVHAGDDCRGCQKRILRSENN